jgi:hypothetical protein
MAQKVPVWMNTVAQVATGNRKMVLENGPDVMNSDDDDALEEEHGNVLTGVYTSEMDPSQGPLKLTPAQVVEQKATAQALKSLRIPPRSQSPIGGSSDEDEPMILNGYGLNRKVACAETIFSGIRRQPTTRKLSQLSHQQRNLDRLHGKVPR